MDTLHEKKNHLVGFSFIRRDDMDLVENDADTLHEETKHLVSRLVGYDMNTLHEEKNHH